MEANDWRNEVFRDEALQKNYEGALAAGNVTMARGFAHEIHTRRRSGARAAEKTLAVIEARKPRRPRPGEESKLSRRRDALTRRAATLEAKKQKLLAALVDVEGADFGRAERIDRDLATIRYETRAVEERLGEIARHHDLEAARKRQEQQSRAREKAEAERQRKIAALDGLASETSAAWGVVTRNLAAIRSGARELDCPEARWLNAILEATGARESIAPVCGLGAGAWVFPRPE